MQLALKYAGSSSEFKRETSTWPWSMQGFHQNLKEKYAVGPKACTASVKNHSITSLSESRWRARPGLWQVWGHSGQSFFQPQVEQFWNLGSCRKEDEEPEKLNLTFGPLSFSVYIVIKSFDGSEDREVLIYSHITPSDQTRSWAIFFSLVAMKCFMVSLFFSPDNLLYKNLLPFVLWPYSS